MKNVHAVYGGEVLFDADEADGNLTAKRYTLSGHVRLHETDTTIHAEEVTFDGAAQWALAANALITRTVFTLRAPRIEATTQGIAAYDGDLTTVPNGGAADYRLHAQRITLDQQTHRGVLHNVSLYLLGARLLTVPRVTFHFGGAQRGSGHQVTLPVIGASTRYGTYLSFGSGLHVGPVPFQYRLLLPMRQSIEASLSSRQTLYAPRQSAARPAARPAPTSSKPVTLLERIHALATVPPARLPDGDALLFHDFLPDPNPIALFDTPSRGGLTLAEDLSVHLASVGNRRDDLYISRLPEVALSGELPLTRIPTPPAYGDPKAFRDSLKHIVLYAEVQETIGDYREQPTNIRARRVRSQIGLSAHPILIAPNTVMLPSLLVSTSGYSGSKDAYRYDQVAIAVNHYFSDLTALGIQFLASTTGGNSPFNFDVLDTSRELDVRLQLGNRRLAAAGRVRYDLSGSNVIDYQIAVAPMLRGFSPVFSYDFRSRSFGLGIEVKGLTF